MLQKFIDVLPYVIGGITVPGAFVLIATSMVSCEKHNIENRTQVTVQMEKTKQMQQEILRECLASNQSIEHCHFYLNGVKK